MNRTFTERLFSRVIVDPVTGCWVWQGARKTRGMPYGTIQKNGEKLLCHRASWEIYYGPIPEDTCVLHRCDNPPCCRPDHLFLGTHTDNIADRDKKKRHAHGVTNGMTKLTEDQVREIRAAIGVPQTDLAQAYGVCQQMISNIRNRLNWAHLP